MVTIHGYNKEKINKVPSDIYVIAILGGLFLAVFLIVGLKGFIYLLGIGIKYWPWVIGVLFILLFSKKIFFKRRRR